MNDIDREIEFHIDALTRDLMAGGMSESEARAEALRRFGNVGEIRRTLLRPRVFTALTLLALTIASAMHRLLWFLPVYASLHSHHPYYYAESIKNLCEVGVCLAALLVMRPRSIARALGLDRRVPQALAFAAAASWPTLLGLALARSSHVTNWLAVVYLAFLSPFAEELVVRGFAFRSLRRIGWRFWPAAILIGLVGGLTHIEKGQTRAEILGLFLVIGVGNVTFSWLVERWDSLWFPFALHASMNFWWEFFNVAPTALGGWYAFAVQNATIVLAILITLRFTKRRDPLQPVGEDRLGDRVELHVRRSLVDLPDLRVAPELFHRIFLRVAVATKQLHGQ
jgi:membrane protease YdiL (CAAX protease family)